MTKSTNTNTLAGATARESAPLAVADSTVTAAEPVNDRATEQPTNGQSDAQYTVKAVCQRLGKSESMVKQYKALVVKAFETCPELVLTPRKRLTSEGFAQIKRVSEMSEDGQIDRYISELQSERPELLPSIPTASVEVQSPGELTISEGNHQRSLTVPNPLEAFSLSTLRGNNEVVSFDDPLVLAQQVIAQNNQLVGAMQQHAEKQAQSLKETRQALQMVKSSNSELATAAIEYKIDSRVTGALLTSSTAELNEQAQEAVKLGKQRAENA